MIYIAAGTVFWVVCGVLSYGADFAYFQRMWPTIAVRDYDKDRRAALIRSVFGPISLMVAVVMSSGLRSGFKWR